MSEHHEFLAIDRPLTTAEKNTLGEVSSIVKLTDTSANFTYSYGDFPGNPIYLLTQYFDVMYYISNWGAQRLAFRFPKDLIDSTEIEPYCIENTISLTFTGDWAILDWQFSSKDGFGGIEERQNIVEELGGLRQEILQRDYRGLYLAWLRMLTSSGDSAVKVNLDQLEPPVPEGLSKLSPAQIAFSSVFELSQGLMIAAANLQHQQNIIVDRDLKQAIEQLSRPECNEWLFQLVQAKSNLSIDLQKRLSQSIGTCQSSTHPRRTIQQLLTMASQLKEQLGEFRREIG